MFRRTIPDVHTTGRDGNCFIVGQAGDETDAGLGQVAAVSSKTADTLPAVPFNKRKSIPEYSYL